MQEMSKVMEDMRNEDVLAERKEIARTYLMGELSCEKQRKVRNYRLRKLKKWREKRKEIIYKGR